MPHARLLIALLLTAGLGVLLIGTAAAARRGPRQPRLQHHPADPTTETVATFTFTTPETNVSFECAIDRGPYVVCLSPFVTPPLAAGDREFAVRARATSGDRSAPSTFRWRVLPLFGQPDGQNMLRSTRAPQPEAGGGGAFRIKCAFSHASYDDPIVFPNQPGRAHLHLFFGNRATDAASDALTLARAGDSTCHGGALNRSAYWIPAVLAPVGDAWRVVLPADGYGAPDIYYKVDITDRMTLQPMPTGLRMIAGRAAATAPQSNEIVRWSCRSWRITSADDFAPTIPRCAVGDSVQLNLNFPACWDGATLYAPDQRHMAYPVSERRGSGYVRRCPLSHPVALPQVSFHVIFPVTRENAPHGDSRGWRLASDHYTVSDSVAGGLTAHGDWMMGWNPDVMQALVEHCLRAGLNCANGELGNGWRLAAAGALRAAALPAVVNAGMGHGMAHAAGAHADHAQHDPSAVMLAQQMTAPPVDHALWSAAALLWLVTTVALARAAQRDRR